MKVPLQKISDPVISSSGVNLYVFRLDMVHPTISGNKFFKLKYNLEEAKRRNQDTLLTFGGAFSNHIAAVAAAGKEFGFKTIGIIRGDELTSEDNHTLSVAKGNGMRLDFVSREDYKKRESDGFIQFLKEKFGDFYLLPEGGTNDLAIRGCMEILSYVNIPFDYVCCPVGTGGTMAGIVSAVRKDQRAIGFSVLKGDFLQETVQGLLPYNSLSNWEINTKFHFGGYAKYTPDLAAFMDKFEDQNKIPLDQVYTGKMMFGVYALIKKAQFAKNSTVIAIHTGGLQGRLH